MAILNITEFSDVYTKDFSEIEQVQNITFDATASVTSRTFSPKTKLIRLISTEACWLEFGTSPTAVIDSGILLTANNQELFNISSSPIKVAVIQSSYDDVQILVGKIE